MRVPFEVEVEHESGVTVVYECTALPEPTTWDEPGCGATVKFKCMYGGGIERPGYDLDYTDLAGFVEHPGMYDTERLLMEYVIRETEDEAANQVHDLCQE